MTDEGEKKKKILETVSKERVKFVATDILGFTKSVTIPSSRLEKVLDEGVLFDGSSIVGYATIEESDLRAVPDLNTFAVLPWSSQDVKSAGMICDIYNYDNKRFTGDPRYVLQRALDNARELGFIYNTGPEFEFFLLKFDENMRPTTEGISTCCLWTRATL
jgi:glutamine synthetase